MHFCVPSWQRSLAAAILMLILAPATINAEDRESADSQQIKLWVRDLGSPSSRKRERATTALIYRGHVATNAVAKAAASDDYEASYRAFHILATQFTSADTKTRRAASTALSHLAESDHKIAAYHATKTLTDLIARPRAAAITRLQELGATVQVGGELGNPKTPITVTINDDWSGSIHDLQALHELHNLQALHIQIYDAGDEVFTVLDGLTSLTQLSLRSLNPTKRGLAQLARITNLRDLDLSYTLIDDDGLKSLSALKNLERLNLQDTLVTGQCIPHLQQFPELKHLSLAATRLNAKEFELLASVQQLEHVEVSHSQFSGDSLMALAQLGQLESVTAQGARVSSYDVEDFSDVRSDVKVDLTSNQ